MGHKRAVARNVLDERPVFLKGIDCHDHVDSPVKAEIGDWLDKLEVTNSVEAQFLRRSSLPYHESLPYDT